MNLKDFLTNIDNLDFNQIIRRETREYLDKNLHNVLNRHNADYKKVLNDGQRRFSNNGDKVIYYIEVINYLNEEITNLKSRIRYDFIANYNASSSSFSIYDHETYMEYKRLDEYKTNLEALIFYSVRELEKLGMKNIDKNTFSIEEVHDLKRKVDAILIKLDQIHVGQEIIFDNVDELKSDFNELKSDFPLGKKRWYQRATGIVVNYSATKGADEIYNHLRPLLKELLHRSQLMDKLLKN